MASKGNERNLNTGLLELALGGSQTEGMYSDLFGVKQNFCVYSFGKAAGADPGMNKFENESVL